MHLRTCFCKQDLSDEQTEKISGESLKKPNEWHSKFIAAIYGSSHRLLSTKVT